MVARLVVFLLVVVLAIVAITYLTFRYFERQAQREHERRMARDQRDYDTIVEYAEEDSRRARERETNHPPDDEHDTDREPE